MDQSIKNLNNRSLLARGRRRLLAKLRSLCLFGLELTEDTRVQRAWRKGWESNHYLRLLRWRDEGFSPKCIYDIGANSGQWCEMCHELFLPEQCYLFEPQLALRHEISKHKPKAGGEWKIFSIALADRDDTRTLYLAKNLAASSLLVPTEGLAANAGATSTVGRTEVKTIRLDNLVDEENLRAPNLVKIDVQGFEDRVLAGGTKTIAQAQRIVIEASIRQVYKDQVMLSQLLASLVKMGFELEDVSEAYREWPRGTLWQVDLWLTRRQ